MNTPQTDAPSVEELITGFLAATTWREHSPRVAVKYARNRLIQWHAERVAEMERKADAYKEARDKHWDRLCATVEAMGKVAPEAAPYAEKWAAALKQERDELRGRLASAQEAILQITGTYMTQGSTNEQLESAMHTAMKLTKGYGISEKMLPLLSEPTAGGEKEGAQRIHDLLFPKFHDLREELCAWLDAQTITSENIGDIRRSCFVPFDSAWNGVVRDETAKREKDTPSPQPDLDRVVSTSDDIGGSVRTVCRKADPAPSDKWVPKFAVGQRVRATNTKGFVDDTIVKIGGSQPHLYALAGGGWWREEQLDTIPWSLPAPPAAQSWHRADWTEDMLPEGWRPLLLGEVRQYGDECLYKGEWQPTSDTTACTSPSHLHYRTRRPLPALPSTKKVKLGPEDVPPGSAIRPSITEPEYYYLVLSTHHDGITYAHRKDVRFRSYQSLFDCKDEILRPNTTQWAPCWKEVADQP